MNAHALYLHIPFCQHRCAYCDFTTYVGQDDKIPAYVDALIQEIELVARSSSTHPLRSGQIAAKSIFFGGGTPSLLAPSQLASVVDALRANFDLVADAEISLEANPGTVSAEYLQELREIGFNRISFGVQSAHPEDLFLLERIHDFLGVIRTVYHARQAGFRNVSLDLIFGLPEQSLQRWQETFKQSLNLNPEHLSIYALTIEDGTPFGNWANRGMIPLPNPDLSADMYEWASEFLAEKGYMQYEISNWAKSSNLQPSTSQPFYACKHNLQYWRNFPYLGFGAGAHGYANGVRYSNVTQIKSYIKSLSQPSARTSQFPMSPATIQQEKIDKKTEMQETMMLGLRLTQEGVSAEAFQARFGRAMQDVFGEEVDGLLNLGLLEWDEGHLHLTSRARILGDQVFCRFVG